MTEAPVLKTVQQSMMIVVLCLVLGGECEARAGTSISALLMHVNTKLRYVKGVGMAITSIAFPAAALPGTRGEHWPVLYRQQAGDFCLHSLLV